MTEAMSQSLTGGEAIVEAIRAHGVDTVFALPGVQTYPLMDALKRAEPSIRVIGPRHEQATAYMAETYFKQMIASFAFVIEGRSDDELPEVLIGQGAQICYPDPALAIKAGDWFTGQSPLSDETPSHPALIQEEKVESTKNEKTKDAAAAAGPAQEYAIPSLGIESNKSDEDTVNI